MAAQAVRGAEWPPGWRSLDMQAGGWVTGFSGSADGTVTYARTDVGGLYLSRDGGGTWRLRSGGMRTPAGLLVQGVAAHPRERDTALMAVGASYLHADAGRGLWRSRDAGKTWRHVLAGVNYSGNDPARWGGECLAHHAKNPATVYAGSRDAGIHRSHDGGETWHRVASFEQLGGSIDTLAVNEARADEVWAGGSAGLWASTDGGGSWTLRYRAAAHPQIYRLLLRRDGMVFAATGGALLRLAPPAPAAPSAPGPVIPSSSAHLLNPATSPGPLNPPGPEVVDLTAAFDAGAEPKGALTALLFVDGDESRLLASRIGAPTRVSTDGGAAWSAPWPVQLRGAFPKHSFVHPTLVWGRNSFFQRPAAPGEWLLTGGYGALRSRDGGQSFEHAVDGMSITVAYRPTFHPTDPRVVYLPISDWVMGRLVDGAVADYARVVLAGGGANVDLTLSNATNVLVSAASPGRLYLLGGSIYDSALGKEHGALYVSDDSGATYRRAAGAGLPTGPATTLVDGAVSARDAQRLAVLVEGDAAERGVFVSANAGESFVRATGLRGRAPTIFGVTPAFVTDPADDARRLLWLPGGGLFVSGDEGRTWTAGHALPEAMRTLPGALVADPARPGRLYLAISDSARRRGGLWRSRDRGLRWERLEGWRSATSVDASGPVLAVLGVRRGAGFGVWKTRDGGGRWTQLTVPKLRLPNATSLRLDPRDPRRLLVATNGLGVFEHLQTGPAPATAKGQSGDPAAAGAVTPEFPPLPALHDHPANPAFRLKSPTPTNHAKPNPARLGPGTPADTTTQSEGGSTAEAAAEPDAAACEVEPLEPPVAEPTPVALPEARRSDDAQDEANLALLRDADVARRAAAIRALSASGGPRATEGLLLALTDAEALLRLEAVDALSRLGSARAVEGLVTALRDETSGVRGAAVRGLGAQPSPRATEGLVTALLDGAAALRLDALRLLAARPGGRAVEGLVAALSDAELEVRLAAVEALAPRGEPRALEGLGLAARDPALPVRTTALRALAARAGRGACMALLAAARAGDEATRRLAKEALRARQRP